MSEQVSNPPTRIGLPVLALCLAALPIAFYYVAMNYFPLTLSGIAILAILVLPIVGLILGIAALSRGKTRIGGVGKALSIVAISIPACMIAFVLIFFAGVFTGLIPFM